VKGDIAAAIGVMKLDTRARKQLGRGKKIFPVPVAAHRDDGWVFHDQKLVRNLAALAPLHQHSLKFERFAVRYSPEIAKLTAKGLFYAGPRPLASRRCVKH
jgi:hypothetical protein